MIKAIIFDCFGVLVSDGWLPFKRKYFGDTPALMEETTRLNHLVDAGALPYKDFIHSIAQLAHINTDEAHTQIENNPSNMPLFEYIQSELAPHYTLGILSNAAENWLDELFTAEQLGIFTDYVLSFQIGVIKPQPEAYQAIATKLGVALDECIFIDDQPAYCEGAGAVGMKAIHYTDIESLKTQLARYLS
ncbi:MAG: HAD-IA family hydrolase [Candidatus Saccharimonadales bacterium]